MHYSLQIPNLGISPLSTADSKNKPSGFTFGIEKNRASPYWKEFTDCVDAKAGVAYVVCKLCKTKIAHPSHTKKKNTSGMKSHLEGCIKYKQEEHKRRREERAFSTIEDDFFAEARGIDSPIRGNMTADKLCEQMLRIITEGNLPFLFAENREQVKLLRHAYPGVGVPNRRSVAAKLKGNVTTAKQQLKERLANVDSKISLALDAWTTRNNVAFLGMCVGHVRCNRIAFPQHPIPLFPVTFEIMLIIA